MKRYLTPGGVAKIMGVVAERGLPLPALVGVRGAYPEMGPKATENDRGIYDDAIVLVWHRGVSLYTANTDPSVRRKGVAVLRPGLYYYRVGIHGITKPLKNRYRALVQASPVDLWRDDGDGSIRVDNVWVGINIHRGGWRETSSLGCQTIWPEQWDVFMQDVERAMQEAQVGRIPYLLINGPLEVTEDGD